MRAREVEVRVGSRRGACHAWCGRCAPRARAARRGIGQGHALVPVGNSGRRLAATGCHQRNAWVGGNSGMQHHHTSRRWVAVPVRPMTSVRAEAAGRGPRAVHRGCPPGGSGPPGQGGVLPGPRGCRLPGIWLGHAVRHGHHDGPRSRRGDDSQGRGLEGGASPACV